MEFGYHGARESVHQGIERMKSAEADGFLENLRAGREFLSLP